ncbi:hypothetical protein EUTSA_v10017383mg [Eutrema salsugineum]|uniref:Uncharacterized protein n=1 Tax=Eutrema salsugineum TaxID=72664 RepID=V4M679_EUTSA|nr:uncharacterized protein LOC18028002 [Eutrema salsugineum]ESQ51779.1 hypothetical protein EUTSA_v10017383mg [Eutrema salsugineum]
MGSEVINPIKTRFDISMSRRTRKPWSSLINEQQEVQDLSTQSSQPEKEQEQEEDQEVDRKSLNNLMRCEQETNEEAQVNNKSSLGQHFGDDKGIKQTMQLVVKKEKQGGENGVKFKGMMGRYVKVLSGLIKAKRDRKTSVLRFKT